MSEQEKPLNVKMAEALGCNTYFVDAKESRPQEGYHVITGWRCGCTIRDHGLANINTEVPLHVKVAAALGWQELRPDFKYPDGKWRWEGKQLLRPKGEEPRPEPRAHQVPEYDVDSEHAGWLIEKFVGGLWQYTGSDAQLWWGAQPKNSADADTLNSRGPDHSLLVAVCNLIVALHEAGKIKDGELA